MTDQHKKIIHISDRTMFGAVCALVYFLPISAALVEWGFSIALLSFFVKRGTLYKAKMDEKDYSSDAETLKKKIFTFIKAFRPVHCAVNKPIAMYLGIIFLSLSTSYYPLLAFEALFSKVLQNIFTALLVLEALSSKKRIKIFISIFLVSMSLVLINSFVQYSSGEGFLRGRILKHGRLVSSFRFANDYAAYLVIVIPMLFSLAILQPLRLAKKRDVYLEKTDSSGFFGSRIFSMLLGVLLLAQIVCLGLSYSRAGWLAMGCSLFLLLRKHKKIMVCFIVGVLIFSAIFIPKMMKERKSNISPNLKSVFTNTSTRNVTWKNASKIIKDHAALGVGLNNYSKVSHSYKFVRSEYPHNCYLQLAAEIGLVGLGFFIWLYIVFFRNALTVTGQIRDTFFYHLQLGVIYGIAGFLIHSFFDTFFYSTQLSNLLWLMVGLVLAISNVLYYHEPVRIEQDLGR